MPDRVIGGWWRKEGHTLHPGDLEAVFEAAPEVLVVGKGASGQMQVADKARQALQKASIELVASPTGKAVETYNEMRSEQAVAAALYLTC